MSDAKRLHRSVEVTSKRSETTTVTANPDGTFTAKTFAVPVRVRQGSGWAAVNTHLVVRADGSVGPVATSLPLTFSGGGRDALVSLGDNSQRVTLRWPRELGKPVLSGDTATYREVLPGVDLRLRALVQGFTQVLVVKSPQAAANPALRELRFGLSTSVGLSYRIDKSGNPQIVDSTGKMVLGSSAPVMWDSTPRPPATRAAPLERVSTSLATGPTQWSRRAVGTIRVAGAQLVLKPDLRMLTGKTTQWPVYIDPPLQAPRDGWTEVAVINGRQIDEPKWNGANDDAGIAKVGFSDWSWPTVTYRSFFQFVTEGLRGKNVLSADFRVFGIHAPSCNGRWFDAYGTDAVSPATNWGNQPGGVIWLGNQNSADGGGSACPAAWRGFDARPIVNWSLANGRQTSTIMLKAGSETDNYAWKKFDANSAYLATTYNTYPNIPTAMTVETKTCVEQEGNEPYVNPHVDNDPSKPARGPQLAATISDADGGPVHGQFEWWTRGGSNLGVQDTTDKASGSVFSIEIPGADAPHGAKLSYRVRGTDGVDFGSWSPWCQVTIDRQGPTTGPTVSSTTYPACGIDDCPVGGGVGRTGTFELVAGSTDTDVAGFRFSLHDNPDTYVAATAGQAQIQVTPPDDGPMDLYVRSVDRAGNVGPITRYEFFVGLGTPSIAHWRLEGVDETTAYDEFGRHHGTLDRNHTGWATGRHGYALMLNGSTSYVSTTNGPAVRTTDSFTVAAWVKIDRYDGGTDTAISQSGTTTSGFALQHLSSAKQWTFCLANADSATASSICASAGTTPSITGRWTHLIGVYDAGLRQSRLYVDGALASTANVTMLWDAAGTVEFGRAKRAGIFTDYWPGSIDEARIYDRTLSAEEIHDLAVSPASEEAFFPLDDVAGTTVVAEVSGNHRVGVANGVTSVTGKVGPLALRFNGTSSSIQTSGPAVRTDSSFTASAWVKPDALGPGARTVLSQDGVKNSGFYLQYRGDTNRWTFLMLANDNGPASGVSAASPTTPTTDEWVHLGAVYDAAAKRLRMYVNGALSGETAAATPWNAAGPLVIGRGKYNGVNTDFWSGTIDDVHVWAGVRTADQIRAEYRRPVTFRTNSYTGQISRYWNLSGHHVVTTAPVSLTGAHYEGSLGLPAPSGATGTVVINSCRNGETDYFLSSLPDCAGATKLGPSWSMYSQWQKGRVAVFSCLNSVGGNHFASVSPSCDGKIVEGLLGYARDLTYLIRSVSRGRGDRISSNLRTASDYDPDVGLGMVPMMSGTGRVALRICQDGDDAFSSTDQACEGKTFVRITGYVWTAPPTDLPSSAELFRCRTGPAGDRFDSLDPDCEGQIMERSLGFVATGV
ncbi:LamG-like jellyroll fold domain-containing protein [Kribbella sp. NPDC003505]|uniref:LamG-like jellyroll fold domain-containing protein n=1 Tax=Kribbella sp. NPDC003505 TaxID=3154448 RepID=UPI0033AF6014